MPTVLPLLFAFLVFPFLMGCDDPSPGKDASTAALESNGAQPDSSSAEQTDAPPDLPEWARDHPVMSPNASIETHDLLVMEKMFPRHPGDGGGHLRIERIVPIGENIETASLADADRDDDSRVVVASSSQRFEMVYRVGEHGIAEGGLIFIAPEPFWYWSPAQTASRDAPGFTTAKSPSADVTLEPDADDGVFRVGGRALSAGEEIEIVYGAGPLGAQVDLFSQRDSEILVGVDADGDGLRAWSKATALFDIVADKAVQIVGFGPAEVTPGRPFEIQISPLDTVGNRAQWPNKDDRPDDQQGTTGFDIDLHPASSTTFASPTIAMNRMGTGDQPLRIEFDAPSKPGTLRIEVRGRGIYDGFDIDLPPIVVRESATPLYWADLHGHSTFSDGTGIPEDYFAYARDVARLDAVALTDHDHWGIRPLDETPDNQREIRSQATAFHQPGRFVTIPGYEWTSWLHGHRHVLYFDASSDEAPIHSSIDPESDRPDELWAALRGQPALTFAHHSAGSPIATNWFFYPDPILEPVTEIASVHGTSEAEDAPAPVDGAIPGYFVRDALMRGARLGFIGSGDSHDGHPGLAQIAEARGQSGLAGIFSSSLDREGLLDALRARRTFATNGVRAWLEVTINETFMGGTLPAVTDNADTQRLHVRFEATAPIERVDLVRSGIVASIPGEQELSLDIVREIPALSPNEFHYVRIVQSDGGVAWSSPIFAEAKSQTNSEDDPAQD